MNGAHTRLAALWDALEAQGATVYRIPLHTITARTANRIATREEWRLAIVCEELTAPPRRLKRGDGNGPLPQLTTPNPQGCASSDPQAVCSTIEHRFDPYSRGFT